MKLAIQNKTTAITSARFRALSSSEACEVLSCIPNLDLGVRGESDSSCWP